MKMARVSDESGRIHFVEPIDGSSGFVLSGSFSEGFQRTERIVSFAKLLAPIEPTTILCVGANYREHAKETGKAIPERPMIFMKTPNTLNHPNDPIEIPTHSKSTKVDYEGELAVVIGKAAKNVSESDALNHVFGYTIANDVSARDWQWEWGQGQYCQGKSFDTFCPLGPYIITADEVSDPQSLRLTTHVNGSIEQNASTSDMIFSVASLISFLSGSKTLLPGTIILTGTPSGVGGGKKPPVYLKAGDTVSITIDKIGTLANPVEVERF